ncbi:10688_t:CDS:2 [Entrophospora sp. SA101]|nr:16395_t:CDS:2 [Entrophospora sp. SA101]CAJ0880854.1 10688_t:CDS:2 [Entrophospora sp. SA101]
MTPQPVYEELKEFTVLGEVAEFKGAIIVILWWMWWWLCDLAWVIHSVHKNMQYFEKYIIGATKKHKYLFFTFSQGPCKALNE